VALKRYIATKDNTVTNAYKADLVTRGTGSNMGLADSLSVFSIYAQAASSSAEASRFLVQFPVLTANSTGSIQTDRTSGKIPASGSVDFYLRIFNVIHSQTLPRQFTLIVSPVSQSWEEGYGLDMEDYNDLTYDGTGSNWEYAKSKVPWVDGHDVSSSGGSFLTGSSYQNYNYTQYFDNGTEDLEINITGLVEQWLTGTSGGGFSNYGIGVYLTSSQESGNRSYYTKMFSARGSEYFFRRPIIEARWDSTKRDNRGNFYISSSTLNSADNLNLLYLYNYVRGQPKDIYGVGTGSIYLTVHTSASLGEQLTTTPQQPVTGGWVSTGVYSASFALSTTASVVYDKWFSGSTYYHTGSFEPQTFNSHNAYFTPKYITTITNLRSEYSSIGVNRLRHFSRLKNWNPTIYTVASTKIENSYIENAYYKIFRVIDDYTAIDYGTGSTNHTRLSYDISGSYFDLDMSLLESGYSYGIKFLYFINSVYEEQEEVFKFRIR